ncbi:MAG: hypothetical protein JXL80_16240 [Planctomycetes bacterium]|nr:hypothetical protein [Planctomycetota bacterium]
MVKPMVVLSLCGVSLCVCLVPAVAADEDATPSVATVAAGASELSPIKTVEIGRNGEMRVDGRPFIPLKVWLQDPQHFPKLHAAGVNTCAGYWWSDEKKRGSGDTGGMDEYAEMVRRAGFYYIAPFMDEQPEATRKVAAMDHLLAWIHNDEPDLPRKVTGADGKRRSVPRDTLEETAARYKAIKAVDTRHPVIMGLTANFMKCETTHYDEATKARIYPEYVKYCDATGFDTYPIYGSNHPNWLHKVADGVTELRAIAGPKRLVGCTVETCKGSQWITYEKQLEVEPKHTRCEVWMALIRGATAISYFTHAWRPSYSQFACTPEMVAELGRLNAQITRLTPALTADAAKAEIGMALSAEDGAKLDCHFKATQLDGAVYLFAQNIDLGPGADKLAQGEPISPRSGKAVFTVTGLKAGATIEVLDEDRTITAQGGTFTDAFAPLAEHVYRLKL